MHVLNAYLIAMSALALPTLAHAQPSPPIPEEYTWTHYEFRDTELAYTFGQDFLFGIACDRYPPLIVLEVDFDLQPLGSDPNALLSFKRFWVELNVDARSRTDIDFLDGPTLTLEIKNPSPGLQSALIESLAEGSIAEIDLDGNGYRYDALLIGLSESKNALIKLGCY